MGEKIHPGKKAAGEKAAAFVESGMKVGLGTGSTAYWAIRKIGERVAEGLDIQAVATSVDSENLARQWHIPLVHFADIDHLDLDIDGADEVDENYQLIKGGGGALLREKMIATHSKRMVVVVDNAKLVVRLGQFPLPVEVVPFAIEWSTAALKTHCSQLSLRTKNNQPYLTDNGNCILDCHFDRIGDAALLEQTLNQIPGVVENGLFVGLCDTVVVGYADGHTEILQK